MQTTIMINNKLEVAIKYAEFGWSIIPVKEDKTPYLSSWIKYQKEKATIEQINEWWTTWPNANPAVVTGEISKLVVFDIDNKGDEPRSPEEFELRDTVRSTTGNKGWHYFFEHPGYRVKSTNGKLFGSGIDIKADGAYILLASSALDSKRIYDWVREPDEYNKIPQLPEWLEEKIKEDQNEIPTEGKVSPYFNPQIGSRNEKLTSIAGKLLSNFKQEEWDEFVKPIMKTFNKGISDPLSDIEVENIYHSIAKAELSKRKAPQKAFSVMNARELFTTEFADAAWAIDGLFETETVNMISAAPNNYKSWVVYHLAICLAKGASLFGNFKVKKQGVLIINEEDRARQIRERLNALETKWDHLPIHFMISNEIQLEEKTVRSIIGLAKERGVKFVIFDSLRSIHSAEENDSTSMQEVMNFLKQITNAGFTVLFTHHNRKKSIANKSIGGAEETRGSSAINAAVHGHISLEPKKDKDDGTEYLIVSQDKLKGGKKMNPFKILIESTISTMSLIYDGEYGSGKSNTKIHDEILSVITSVGKWLTIDDLVEHDIAKSKSIRENIKALVTEGKLIEVEGKDVRTRSLSVIDDSKSIHHNTKYYGLPPITNS